MKISIFFAWYDFWIGCYYDRKNKTVYFCLIPMIVIKIVLKTKWKFVDENSSSEEFKYMYRFGSNDIPIIINKFIPPGEIYIMNQEMSNMIGDAIKKEIDTAFINILKP